METTQLVELNVKESQTKTETAEQRRLSELAADAIEKAKDHYAIRSKGVVDQKLCDLAAGRPVDFDTEDRRTIAEMMLAHEPVPDYVSKKFGIDGYDDLYTSPF